MFQNLLNAFPKLRCETLKYKVWVRLADGSAARVWYVGAQDDVMQGEGRRRAVWEVAYA